MGKRELRAGRSLTSVTIPNTAFPEDGTEGQLQPWALRDLRAVAAVLAVPRPAAIRLLLARPAWDGMRQAQSGSHSQRDRVSLGSLKTMRKPRLWPQGSQGTRSRSDVAMEPQLILLSTIARRRTIRQKERGSGGRKEMEIHLEQSQSVQPRHRRRGRRGTKEHQHWSF